MKKKLTLGLIISGLAILGATTGFATEVKSSSDGNASAGLILLGLMGIVIASGQMGGFATRNTVDMEPEEEENF